MGDCRAQQLLLQGNGGTCYAPAVEPGVTDEQATAEQSAQTHEVIEGKVKRKRHHPVEFTTFRLMRNVEGISLFFAFFMLLVAALYWIGNYQDFLSDSQRMLLEILEVSGLLCALTSAYYLILLSVWMIRRRFLVVPRIIYAISAIVLGGLFASASSFLTILFTQAG